jgi:hypothetical protein
LVVWVVLVLLKLLLMAMLVLLVVVVVVAAGVVVGSVVGVGEEGRWLVGGRRGQVLPQLLE